MEQLRSILVVVDRGAEMAGVLRKAVALARQFGARIELFLCEAEQAYILAHRYDREGVAKAHADCIAEGSAYLRGLAASAKAPRVEISVAVECRSPLYAAIVGRVLRSRPDLVIKRVTAADPGGHGVADPNDLQLIRACPAALMLARGRAWHAPPRFAAAVDVSEAETSGLPEDVLQSASVLARGWHAQLDAIYGETTSATAGRAHLERLHKLCGERGITGERIRVLYGQPENTLPAFTARQDYDVLILGALTHRPTVAALPGTLTSKLADALDCDFVLVKSSSYQAPVGEQWDHADHAGIGL
jgi:universal stress protein E